ncbi:MAG: pyridoxal 5'-phosphate synthase glutaminase subunit PdxT [Candidatus Gracilibacteria bacterium]
MKIGVLDIQGSVEEHLEALKRLAARGKVARGKVAGGSGRKIEPVLVKKAEDFGGLDGLIIPGGESTTISKLIRLYGLDREIVALAKRGGKILGTCAGAILLARKTGDERVKPLGLIDIDVDRNAYGRQLDSFETRIEAVLNGRHVSVPAVFIRAPIISRVGKGCKVLAKYKDRPVLVVENNVAVATFHPEMNEDLSVYGWFIFPPPPPPESQPLLRQLLT